MVDNTTRYVSRWLTTVSYLLVYNSSIPQHRRCPFIHGCQLLQGEVLLTSS